METDILKWLDEIRKDSQLQWEYRKLQLREDPDDCGGILDAFIRECGEFSGNGILLTGTDRHGSQAAAAQLLQLLEPRGCEGIFLDGQELSEGGAELAKARLNGILDTFYDQGAGVCLVLERLEESGCRREVLNFLGQRLCEYWMYKEELTPLFLILIDDREQDIPGLLRHRLRLYRRNVPSLAKRAAYLEKHAATLKHYLSLNRFAQLTEGVNYAQLRDLVAAANWLVDSLDDRGLTDEELSEFLAEQLPPRPPEEAKQSFYRSVEQLVEQLPQLLLETAGSRMVLQEPVPQLQPVQEPQAAPLDKREEIEKMPPNQLALEVMGEKYVEEAQRRMRMTQ